MTSSNPSTFGRLYDMLYTRPEGKWTQRSDIRLRMTESGTSKFTIKLRGVFCWLWYSSVSVGRKWAYELTVSAHQAIRLALMSGGSRLISSANIRVIILPCTSNVTSLVVKQVELACENLEHEFIGKEVSASDNLLRKLPDLGPISSSTCVHDRKDKI